MLRFNFLGFPVTIHWMFWLVGAMLSGGGGGDPMRIVLWIAAMFVSIMWHEMGHGYAYRKYGGRPSITLYGMGGLCYGHGYTPGKFWRREQLVISLAGPAFGFLLGGLVLLIHKQVANPSPHLRSFIWYMLQINLFWSVVNLLPVFPLDGGQALRAILGDGPGKRKALHLIGAITGAIVAVAGWKIGQPFMAILFGFMAYENFQKMNGKSVPSILGGQ